MKSNDLILTIGIPTFNAVVYLQECIEKILVHSNLLDKIEILVCDNHSTDDTEKIMNGFVSKYPNTIRYLRHNTNLGMDQNFWSCILNAKGEFVHLLGDDDFYTSSGLERLLALLDVSPDLGVVCLSNNYLNTLNGKIIENKEEFLEDILCHSGKEFFLTENLKTLTLSNIVVKKSKCLTIVDSEKLFGTNWLHLAILTEILTPDSLSYIFNFKNPIVTVRIGNQRWLENDGAISYYYYALSVYAKLNSKYETKVFNHIKTLFWQLLLSGGRINYRNILKNIQYSLMFFKFYYDQPLRYLKFSAKLILSKHKPFFEGWEK